MFSQKLQNPQDKLMDEVLEKLDENDPIKLWKTMESSAMDTNAMENRMRSNLNGKAPMTLSAEGGRDSRVNDRQTIALNNTNVHYKALMKVLEESDKKGANGESDDSTSKDTVLKDDELSSAGLFNQFIAPFLDKFDDMVKRPKATDRASAPKELCAECQTPLKFGYFTVR